MKTSFNASLIARQLWGIKSAVQQQEHEIAYGNYMLPARHHEILKGGWKSIRAEGSCQAIYVATPPEQLLRHFEFLSKKYAAILVSLKHILDLGSGLGMACFALAHLFENVTGCEQDPRLHWGAEQIRQDNNITNITFKNRDFRHLSTAEIQAFDAIFAYVAIQNPGEGIEDILFRASPGTLIVLRECDLRKLFESPQFRLLHPKRKSYDPGFHDHEGFFTYIKKG